MPKLVIKQDLPEPSLQDKLEGWLRTFLPLLFLLMIAATAVALYFSQRPVALIGGADPDVVRPPSFPSVVMEAPQVREPASTTPASLPNAQPVAAPPKLPDGFCPLFGPGADECKAEAKKTH